MAKTNSFRNPEDLVEAMDRPPEAKLLLGLDLATSTGYGYSWILPGERALGPQPSWMGQLDLSLGQFDSGNARFVRLWHFLEELKPDAVAFEGRNFTITAQVLLDPKKRTGMKQAEVSASLRAIVSLWCELHNVPCYGVTIQAIKKRATGKGAASKDKVIQACNEEFGTSWSLEGWEKTGVDNIADAAFVLALLIEDTCTGLPEFPKNITEELLKTAKDKLKIVQVDSTALKKQGG